MPTNINAFLNTQDNSNSDLARKVVNNPNATPEELHSVAKQYSDLSEEQSRALGADFKGNAIRNALIVHPNLASHSIELMHEAMKKQLGDKENAHATYSAIHGHLIAHPNTPSHVAEDYLKSNYARGAITPKPEHMRSIIDRANLSDEEKISLADDFYSGKHIQYSHHKSAESLNLPPQYYINKITNPTEYNAMSEDHKDILRNHLVQANHNDDSYHGTIDAFINHVQTKEAIPSLQNMVELDSNDSNKLSKEHLDKIYSYLQQQHPDSNNNAHYAMVSLSRHKNANENTVIGMLNNKNFYHNFDPILRSPALSAETLNSLADKPIYHQSILTNKNTSSETIQKIADFYTKKDLLEQKKAYQDHGTELGLNRHDMYDFDHYENNHENKKNKILNDIVASKNTSESTAHEVLDYFAKNAPTHLHTNSLSIKLSNELLDSGKYKKFSNDFFDRKTNRIQSDDGAKFITNLLYGHIENKDDDYYGNEAEYDNLLFKGLDILDGLDGKATLSDKDFLGSVNPDLVSYVRNNAIKTSKKVRDVFLPKYVEELNNPHPRLAFNNILEIALAKPLSKDSAKKVYDGLMTKALKHAQDPDRPYTTFLHAIRLGNSSNYSGETKLENTIYGSENLSPELRDSFVQHEINYFKKIRAGEIQKPDMETQLQSIFPTFLLGLNGHAQSKEYIFEKRFLSNSGLPQLLKHYIGQSGELNNQEFINAVLKENATFSQENQDQINKFKTSFSSGERNDLIVYGNPPSHLVKEIGKEALSEYRSKARINQALFKEEKIKLDGQMIVDNYSHNTWYDSFNDSSPITDHQSKIILTRILNHTNGNDDILKRFLTDVQTKIKAENKEISPLRDYLGKFVTNIFNLDDSVYPLNKKKELIDFISANGEEVSDGESKAWSGGLNGDPIFHVYLNALAKNPELAAHILSDNFVGLNAEELKNNAMDALGESEKYVSLYVDSARKSQSPHLMAEKISPKLWHKDEVIDLNLDTGFTNEAVQGLCQKFSNNTSLNSEAVLDKLQGHIAQKLQSTIVTGEQLEKASEIARFKAIGEVSSAYRSSLFQISDNDLELLKSVAKGEIPVSINNDTSSEVNVYDQAFHTIERLYENKQLNKEAFEQIIESSNNGNKIFNVKVLFSSRSGMVDPSDIFSEMADNADAKDLRSVFANEVIRGDGHIASVNLFFGDQSDDSHFVKTMAYLAKDDVEASVGVLEQLCDSASAHYSWPTSVLNVVDKIIKNGKKTPVNENLDNLFQIHEKVRKQFGNLPQMQEKLDVVRQALVNKALELNNNTYIVRVAKTMLANDYVEGIEVAVNAMKKKYNPQLLEPIASKFVDLCADLTEEKVNELTNTLFSQFLTDKESYSRESYSRLLDFDGHIKSRIHSMPTFLKAPNTQLRNIIALRENLANIALSYPLEADVPSAEFQRKNDWNRLHANGISQLFKFENLDENDVQLLFNQQKKYPYFIGPPNLHPNLRRILINNPKIIIDSLNDLKAHHSNDWNQVLKINEHDKISKNFEKYFILLGQEVQKHLFSELGNVNRSELGGYANVDEFISKYPSASVTFADQFSKLYLSANEIEPNIKNAELLNLSWQHYLNSNRVFLIDDLKLDAFVDGHESVFKHLNDLTAKSWMTQSVIKSLTRSAFAMKRQSERIDDLRNNTKTQGLKDSALNFLEKIIGQGESREVASNLVGFLAVSDNKHSRHLFDLAVNNDFESVLPFVIESMNRNEIIPTESDIRSLEKFSRPSALITEFSKYPESTLEVLKVDDIIAGQDWQRLAIVLGKVENFGESQKVIDITLNSLFNFDEDLDDYTNVTLFSDILGKIKHPEKYTEKILSLAGTNPYNVVALASVPNFSKSALNQLAELKKQKVSNIPEVIEEQLPSILSAKGLAKEHLENIPEILESYIETRSDFKRNSLFENIYIDEELLDYILDKHLEAVEKSGNPKDKMIDEYTDNQSTYGRIIANPNLSYKWFQQFYEHKTARHSGSRMVVADFRRGNLSPEFYHPKHGRQLFENLEVVLPSDVTGFQPKQEGIVREFTNPPKAVTQLKTILPYIVDSIDFKTLKNQMSADGIDIGKLEAVKQLFGKHGKVTPEDIAKAIEQYDFEKYYITYSVWTGGQRHSNANNLVIQLNMTKRQSQQLAQDPKLYKFFQFIQKASTNSGHPITPYCLSWVRVDASASREGAWIVEEFQSDFSKKLRTEIEKYRGQSGKDTITIDNEKYTIEEALRYAKQVEDIAGDWGKASMHGIEELAKSQGIHTIYIHGVALRFNLAGLASDKGIPKKIQELYYQNPRDFKYTPVNPSEYPHGANTGDGSVMEVENKDGNTIEVPYKNWKKKIA